MRILDNIGAYVGAVSGDRATLAPQWRVTRVAETGSTNADLLAAARLGEPAGAVLVTDHQTAGRGRLGRTWIDPAGASLLVSVLLRPGNGRSLHGATQAAGLAMQAACRRVADVDAELKWPNDLVVGSRKLAGILAEVVADSGVASAVVIGVGVNVNWPEPVPVEVADLAVALNHVAGRPVDRDALLEAFLAELTTQVDAWEGSPATLLADYRTHLATIGRDVWVDEPAGRRRGHAVDVDDDGALLVDFDGGVRRVTAGDIHDVLPDGGVGMPDAP
jgi:BirA family biotin operon repressor/biotin-[acetyl-CoA-carboxylase] ligase